MRIYRTFAEAINETRRDLGEMGITVHPHTMQDKYVADDKDFETRELQNYGYTVLNAANSVDDLTPFQPWADAEFEERVSDHFRNPGNAWRLRSKVWVEFLHDNAAGEPQFAYTYNERMAGQLKKIIREIKSNPDSRQLYLSIWNPDIDAERIGNATHRVPCSLGYLFQVRNNQLNITYYMRSCDFATHFQNDVYLAVELMKYVAEQTGIKPGDFTHFINSLHIYNKDIKGVF